MLSRPIISDEQRREFCSIINRSGEVLLRIITDALDLSKIESNALTIHRERFSLNQLLEDLQSMFEGIARSKGLSFSTVCHLACPPEIVTDRVRLKQILINLLHNACKFTKAGSVNLSVEPTDDRITALHFRVTDTGIGISEADKDKLFKPFSQIRGEHQVDGGTGLGLCLSRQIAHLLRGTLEIESSTPEQGTTFSVIVPIEIAQQPRLPIHREVTIERTASPLQGVSVLVVEDMDDNWLLMKHTLQQIGAHADRAADGLIGVQMAMSGGYDIVLMDLAMPRLTGFEATQSLRSRGYTTPIVAVSATATPTCRAEAIAAGCNDHIAKPFKAYQLISVMQRHLPSLPRVVPSPYTERRTIRNP